MTDQQQHYIECDACGTCGKVDTGFNPYEDNGDDYDDCPKCNGQGFVPVECCDLDDLLAKLAALSGLLALVKGR